MKISSPAPNVWRSLKRPLSITSRKFLGTITGVETCEPVLALTFDDGPHPDYTMRLLEILDKYQAKATFFCVGKFAASHPQVIRQAVESGHVVGNHSWDHPSFPLLTHRERWEQIEKCAEALKPYRSRLFRPPYGQQSHASRLDLWLHGYHVVGWTHDSGDWHFPSSDEIMREVLPGIQPGRIIIFHDRIATARSGVHFNRQPTIAAVEQLLESLSGSYRFVTVPELAQYGQLRLVNWYRKANAAWLNELIEDRNVRGRQYPVDVSGRTGVTGPARPLHKKVS